MPYHTLEAQVRPVSTTVPPSGKFVPNGGEIAGLMNVTSSGGITKLLSSTPVCYQYWLTRRCC
ncbi:hypothetical protein KCP77_08155 [Salmonella enterica subsp. enterica]|nr:hypothetical protein KCP77_08155 [Salmonella enterica subsp. enterica]